MRLVDSRQSEDWVQTSDPACRDVIPISVNEQEQNNVPFD